MSSIDRLHDALEVLLADKSPRTIAANLDRDEKVRLRMAQMIRGSRTAEPSPEFVARLRDRLHRPPRRVTRRAAVVSSIGALAAGVLGGVGIDRGILQGPSSSPLPPQQPLVSKGGKWFAVAALGDLPEGTVRSFTAGAVHGVLVNQHLGIWSISRICTHMGCALTFEAKEQRLICPCHGAEIDLHGTPEEGPQYPPSLRPLPAIGLRVRAESIVGGVTVRHNRPTEVGAQDGIDLLIGDAKGVPQSRAYTRTAAASAATRNG